MSLFWSIRLSNSQKVCFLKFLAQTVKLLTPLFASTWLTLEGIWSNIFFLFLDTFRIQVYRNRRNNKISWIWQGQVTDYGKCLETVEITKSLVTKNCDVIHAGHRMTWFQHNLWILIKKDLQPPFPALSPPSSSAGGSSWPPWLIERPPQTTDAGNQIDNRFLKSFWSPHETQKNMSRDGRVQGGGETFGHCETC